MQLAKSLQTEWKHVPFKTLNQMNNYVPSHSSPIIIFPLDVKVSSVNKRKSPGVCPGLSLVSSGHCWPLIGFWGGDDRDMTGHFPDKPHWLTDNSESVRSLRASTKILCALNLLWECWVSFDWHHSLQFAFAPRPCDDAAGCTREKQNRKSFFTWNIIFAN